MNKLVAKGHIYLDVFSPYWDGKNKLSSNAAMHWSRGGRLFFQQKKASFLIICFLAYPSSLIPLSSDNCTVMRAHSS
jgi:hypothetical protein